MLNSWTCLLILCTLTALSFSLPTSLNKDAKKTDQMRIKPKRAQETLMFGNQQNRQPENRGNPYVSSTEKRALNAAGLDSLKMSLTKENKFPNAKSPRNSLDERNVYNPHDNKNYEYGKVIVTEEGDEIPQVSDVASYTRYYMNDDRRKRLEKLIPNIHTTTVPPSCTEYHMPYPTQNSPIQTKKSIPIYAEPRYKREVEIHPEPVWNLLSMWGNGHRNRYTNEEYDNEEDGDLIEDEDPRNALAWMNAPGYSSYRYGTDTLPPSEIGIVHTHPSAYYDQYENQYGQQFDNGAHPYINQYGSLYSQDSYYPTERKYITAKKRTPSYDSYINVVPLQMGIRPRVYPPYPHHMVY
ncbi:PREDICTED: prohormone-2-like isoform X2 [Polistes canadensis]|uniref:prohormone-2-like isoform X2 n=1 Tax=Polistes canadensis TaxID=91411 RepID=UPI000718F163|nr:PREDICTED: prohormone-2-like isoform X2 [Polistes canadensis]